LTPGSFQSPGARVNIFIAKLDPTGSSVIFSSLFGGSFNDVPDAIAVDPSGNAYIDGWGYSGDLPVSPGAFASGSGRFVKASSGPLANFSTTCARIPRQGRSRNHVDCRQVALSQRWYHNHGPGRPWARSREMFSGPTCVFHLLSFSSSGRSVDLIELAAAPFGHRFSTFSNRSSPDVVRH